MKNPPSSPDSLLRLIQRELRRRNRALPGGVIWVFLEPVITVSLLSIGFSWVLRSPPLGQSFALFFASGFGAFMVFQSLSGAVGHGFVFLKNKGRVWWPEALLARVFVNGTFAISAAAAIGIGAATMSETPPFVDLYKITTALGLSALLGIGIGVLNCALFSALPLWRPVWNVASRVVFLASGVLFLPEHLPHNLQPLVAFNPLCHMLGLLRDGVYVSYTPRYADVLFPVLTGLFLGALGLALLVLTHPIPRAARRRISGWLREKS